MADTQDPPASGGSKTFGIHKYDPNFCLGAEQPREARRRGYEDKFEDDAMGEELSDDARIWRVMLDEGRANDTAMLQRFRDHLDVDLVFAGLFSAVLTTFVAQTSQPPSDTGDTTIALLLEIIAIQRAWANNPRVNDVASFSLPPPSPTPSSWINRCWFLSLIFSLLAAFGAVVVRQWLQEYESDIIGPPKRRALVRHYRRVGLEKYKVHLIVPILPMLLHVSLLLFFVGLTLYVRQSDRSMSDGIIALTTIIYLVYLGTNILPVFRPRCPYRSPLSTGAHWARSLVASLYFLLPARLRMKALLPIFLRSISSAASHVHALVVFRKALKKNWKEVFKTPDAHEWEAVRNSSDTLIPSSLNSMTQASSDLSVTPLIVQASYSLPVPHDNYGSENPCFKELIYHHILPWFVSALRTRRTIFDWTPGRENELQRMACVLLLVPLQWTDNVLWDEIDTTQYRTCVSRVFQALAAALLDLPSAPTTTTTDVATLSMALLALGNRLDDLDPNSRRLQIDALFDTIDTAYVSLPEPPSLAVLRLRPIIWHQALTYLRYYERPTDDAARFAITLWRSAYSEAPFSDDDDLRQERLAVLPRVSLQEWLYLCPRYSEDVSIGIHRLLCPPSCESYTNVRFYTRHSDISRLHTACHAIDSYVKGNSADGNAAFDDDLGFLAMRFTDLLLAILEYDSLDSALRLTGYMTVSAAFKSTFLSRPALLSTAKSLDADARVPATLAVSLFRLLAEVLSARGTIISSDAQLANRNIVRVLSRHATEYYDALLGEIAIEHLQPAVEVLLQEPALAVLDISDILAAFLTTVLDKATSESNPRTRSSMSADNAVGGSIPSDQPADDVVWCLYLDALCAARATTAQISSKSPDASRKLHSTLLSLEPIHPNTWSSELTSKLENRYIPLSAALALKSTHGCKALAEWVDALPTLMQDPSSGLKVWVPVHARLGEDLDWYRLFTSNPDKHIYAPDRRLKWSLHISELVSFEKAVERMQKTSAERAAKKPQRSSRGDGAEADANDDAENPSSELDQLEDEGGAKVTHNETTDRLRSLGAWVAAPLQRIARIPGLRQVGRRERPSSFALNPRDIDTDVERIAGTSVARDSGRSGGDPRISAWASEGGSDGEHAQDDGKCRAGEQTRGSAQEQYGEHERDGEHEQGQPEDATHIQRGQTPDEGVGTDAREDVGSDAHEDVEYGGTTSARGTPDAGGGGEQDHEGEQVRDGVHGQAEEQVRGGEHGRYGAHDQTGEPARGDRHGRDGEQDRDDAQDPNSAQSQAHEVPHTQTQETEVELRARDGAVDEGEH
ncbi:hypothetical protein EV122DRAFT_215447 [Schizophyllum commune]